MDDFEILDNENQDDKLIEEIIDFSIDLSTKYDCNLLDILLFLDYEFFSCDLFPKYHFEKFELSLFITDKLCDIWLEILNNTEIELFLERINIIDFLNNCSCIHIN